MAVRPVVQLPESVLQQRAQEVEGIGDFERSLAEDLVDTMRVSPGCVGLAATQIGVAVRAFSLDVTGHKKAKMVNGLIVLFNPVVIASSGTVSGREGCMSVPDFTGDVERPKNMTVQGLSVDGEVVTYETDAFEARAFQHEIDHLDGLLFLDRVKSPQGVFPRKVYR
jgi:peptide deformylase